MKKQNRRSGSVFIHLGVYFMKRLFFFKGIFIQATGGAYPIFGKLFKRSAGRDTVIGIAYCRIINITARAYIFHRNYLC